MKYSQIARRTQFHTASWTNSDITGLGAVLNGNLKIATIPRNSRVRSVRIIVDGQAAGPTTLTAQVGVTGANYNDYIVAKDLKAAANTEYGGVSGDLGTSLPAGIPHVPSRNAATDIFMRVIATGANLNTVTGSSGRVIVEYTPDIG